MTQTPFATNEALWVSIPDIVQMLNKIPPESVVMRLPAGKIGTDQLTSSAWTEFLYCKEGEYEPNTIDVYSYKDEEFPTSIIHPAKLEGRLVKGIPFFILTSKPVSPITEMTIRDGTYEIIVINERKKRYTEEKVNMQIAQTCINRYLSGKFFIFPKTMDDGFIDRTILQYHL